MYHANVNVNLLEENVIQIKSGIKTNVTAREKIEKNIVCAKVFIWIPATCSCKNGKYLASIIDNSVITCDEITDAVAKLYNKETKTVTTNFNEKKFNLQNKKIIYFTCLFINYHCIIDSC